MHQEELDNVTRLKEMNQENACLRQENTSLHAALAHATPHALSGHPPDAADADGLGSFPRNLGSAFTLAAQQSDSSAPSSPTGTVEDAASTRQEPGSCPEAASGSQVSSGAASPARPSAEAASSGVGPLFLAFDSSPSPERTAPGLHSEPGTSQGRAIRYWHTAAASGDGEEATQQLTPVFVQPTPQAIPAWREENIRQGASVENTPRSAAEHAHHLVAQLSAQVAAVRASAERQPLAVSIQTPLPSRLRHSSGASITLPEAQEGTSEIGPAGQPGADQQCTPCGGNPAGGRDGGLVRRLRAQLGRLSGNRGGCPPGTPMSLAADRRVAFLRAIDRLEVSRVAMVSCSLSCLRVCGVCSMHYMVVAILLLASQPFCFLPLTYSACCLSAWQLPASKQGNGPPAFSSHVSWAFTHTSSLRENHWPKQRMLLENI